MSKENSLYDKFVDEMRRLFGKPNASDAEISDAVDTAKPISEQIAEATKADKDTIKTLTDRVAELEGDQTTASDRVAELEKDVEIKDARIAELQTEITAKEQEHQTAIDGLKKQHTAEVKTLSGKIANMQAGKEEKQDESGGEFETGKGQKTDGVIAVKSDSLKSLLKPSKA